MRFIFNLILGVALVFLQKTLLTLVGSTYFSIDLVLLFIVFIALRRPAWETVIWGGFLGFILDMFAPTYAGTMMLGYSLSAFILANSRETFNLERPLLHGSAILLVSIIQKIILLVMSGFQTNNLLLFILTSILTALVTAVIAIGLDVVIRLIFGKMPFTINSDKDAY